MRQTKEENLFSTDLILLMENKQHDQKILEIIYGACMSKELNGFFLPLTLLI